MVQVVNRSQQVATAGLNPKAAYSRNVIMQMRCRQVGPVNDFAFTAPLGNRFWLLGIKVYFMPEDLVTLIKSTFRFTTGTGIPTSHVTVRDDWEPILQEARLVAQYPEYWGPAGSMEFCMNRLYSGANRRLGCVMQWVATSVDFWAIVSFEISEG